MITEAIGKWILGLSGGAVFCALMCELCPKGAVRGVVKTLCGMLMAVVLIAPLGDFEAPTYSLNLAKYRLMAESAAAAGAEERDAMSRTIIEEECRAYILDKGKALGADIAEASVGLKWSGEGFWYPISCKIKSEYHPGLASAIEAELGLGRESQEWIKP